MPVTKLSMEQILNRVQQGQMTADDAKAMLAQIQPSSSATQPVGVKAVIENGELVIRLPVQDPRASKSGKTQLIATGSGRSTLVHQGKPVFVTVSAYLK